MNRIFAQSSTIVAALIACIGSAHAVEATSAGSTYAIIGDAGRINANSESVRESIQRKKISQLVLPGDNLYHKKYSKIWGPWADAGMTFDVVAIGNHNDGYANEVDYFDMPGEYYSKVIESTRFLVLNSDNDKSGKKQAEWLAGELDAAREPFIFLVYHHPTYDVSHKHSWDEKPKFQLAVRPVIWRFRKKITALIIGHDHLASLLHFDDLPVILSGAVQEARGDTPINGKQDDVKVRTDWYFDPAPYWVRLETGKTARSSAKVDFIRAKDDRISCTAIIHTGKAAELQENCSNR